MKFLMMIKHAESDRSQPIPQKPNRLCRERVLEQPKPANHATDWGAQMKYLMFIKHAETTGQTQPPKALMDAMGEFVGEGFKSGILKDTAGLKPTSEGFRVRLSKGQLKVSDGPFTEAKEVIGGYALVELPSKEEALKVARQFMDLHRVHWPEFECESEVRPVEDM